MFKSTYVQLKAGLRENAAVNSKNFYGYNTKEFLYAFALEFIQMLEAALHKWAEYMEGKWQSVTRSSKFNMNG